MFIEFQTKINSGITWKNSKAELEYIAAFDYYKQKKIAKGEKNYAVLDFHCVYRNVVKWIHILSESAYKQKI